MLGWFRSDETFGTTTGNWEDGEPLMGYQNLKRRILEVQSDLFQKGRDSKILSSNSICNR